MLIAMQYLRIIIIIIIIIIIATLVDNAVIKSL